MRLDEGSGKYIEDRRGQSVRGGGLGRRGLPLGIGGFLLLLVLSLVTGKDFLSLVGGGGGLPVDPGPASAPAGPVQETAEEAKSAQLVNAAVEDIQDNVWMRVLPGDYKPLTLVLFRGAVESACGVAESATGPFYCPADQKAYIDLSFYEELDRRFGAPGDFAQGYVLAHEIGHHVQNLLGIERRVRLLQQQRPDAANQLSVRMELQADCYAGIWGHSLAQRGQLDRSDIEEGLRAASAIGDDKLQKMATGRVQPESFTHGSSEQRMQWFSRGYETGRVDACDTFAAR